MILLFVSQAYAIGLGSAAVGDLIVSEIHSDPAAVVGYRGQWLEVHNTSASEIDLDGLVVSDGGTQSFTVSGALALPAGGHAVFAARSSATINGGVTGVDYTYSTSSYSLRAGSAQVSLSFGATTFDTVDFSAGFPDEHGASMSLSPAAHDDSSNDTAAHWCPAAAVFGDGDYGSPGAANDACPVDLASLSSGDLVVAEVMISPAASDYNKGEWIEVYNASGLYIDLDGLVVDSDTSEQLVLAGETLARPGARVLLAARDNPLVNGGLPDVDYRYLYGSDLTLATTDSLTLSFGATTFDTVSWNSLDYPVTSGAALELNEVAVDATANDTSTNWCAATLVYGDGDYGTPGAANTDCDTDSDSDGFTEDVDCDDGDPNIYPGATEVCDGVDNDCDDSIDEDPSDGATYYADTDGDKYGDALSTQVACSRPDGYRTNSLDCDDTDGTINPAAAETCDGTDDNCSGDEHDASDGTFYYDDVDGDGYGDKDAVLNACSQPVGYLADSSDCDDTDGTINPAAAETCDGTDNNCSGDESDASDAATYFADADNDKYGDVLTPQAACSRPVGFRTNSLDCDDANGAINPAAAETCDGTDNNCSGDESDASDASTWHADSDGDGFGASDSAVSACSQPSGHLADSSDCDDTDGTVHPGAAETCDGTDSNCSGDENDASDTTVYYADADNDKYGDASSTQAACSRPIGYRTNSLDCDDTDSGIHPGAEDVCNDSIDQDCSGQDFQTCDATLADADGVIDGTVADGQLSAVSGDVGDIDGDAAADFAIRGGGQDKVYIFDGSADWTIGSTEGDAMVVLTGAGGSSTGSDLGSGDIDGDGNADLLIGAQGHDGAAADAGGAYVIYGPLSGAVDLTTAADALLTGAAAGDQAGRGVVVIGDVDADGYDDMLITAAEESTPGIDSGAAYLMYGPATSGSLASADAIYTGAGARDYLGRAAEKAGDVDGDGHDDVLVNAYRADETVGETTKLNTGATYLLTSFSSGTHDIATAATGIIYGASALEQVGTALAPAGDVDGDGYDDVLLGSQYADPSGMSNAGEAYLVLGPISGHVNVSDAQARFPGVAAGDAAGRAVAGLGDIDGDGSGDVAVGAKMADENGADSGAAYILLGPLSGNVSLNVADTILSGEAAGDRAGLSLAIAPDLDGGGQPDLLIGAPLSSGGASSGGSSYIVFTERW